MFLEVHIALSQTVVVIDVDRGVQQVEQEELAKWTHLLTPLKAIQDSYVNCSHCKNRDSSASCRLLELALLNSVLGVEVESGLFFFPEQRLCNFVRLLINCLLFKSNEASIVRTEVVFLLIH